MKTDIQPETLSTSDAQLGYSFPKSKGRISRSTPEVLSVATESFRAQIAQSITFQMLANVLTQASSFLSLLIVARLLGKEQYGRFALVQGTVNTFISVGALGLGITATKYVSEYRLKQPERAGRVLALSFSIALLSALIFAIVYIFACPFIVSEDYVARIRIGAICIFFTALNGYQLGALAGFENFQAIARVSAITAFLNPPVTAASAHYFGLAGALVALSSNSFIVWCLYNFAVREECRKWNCKLTFNRILGESRCLLTMSVPASLSGIIGSLATWISTLMLSKQTDGLDQLALWSAANSLRIMVMFIPTILVRVMMPRLNFLLSHGQERRFVYVFRAFVLGNGCVSGGIGLFLAIFSQQLLSLFGKGFIDTNGVVQILLLSAVIEAIAGSLSQALVVHGRMWHQVLAMASWSVVLVMVTRFTVQAGARGIAIANLIAWSVALCIYVRFAHLRGASSRTELNL